MDEETDFIKLPLEERCVHKLWKARVHGYEEATKLFRKIADEKSPEWNKYLGLIKKFVADSNVAAQEKGLEASLTYIENAHVAGKTVGEVMPLIVTKCIGATKAKIKDLAVQICLMYVEIEKQDIVVEELIKGTEHKNPKISAACVTALTQGLKEFGSKVMNVKMLLKRIPSLLEDRDKNVREEAKTLAVELFRWIGPVLKTQLSSLKPIQLQELDVEFDKVADEKPVIQRYLRSQQAKQSKLAEAADDDEGDDEPDNEAANDIDPLDLIQPVDILSKLPKDFLEKIEAKKWQERKEVLDCLEQLLTNAPKLENGDYGDLIRALKKVVTKDSNVILVGIAAKCTAMLAKGLKKKFQPFAAHCFASYLEKFKEKKQNVVVNLRDAVDAIYDSTTLEAVQEDIIASMENKNPAVKAETVAFLARCFTKCNALILNKKLLKAFTSALLKTLNESDPLVRDNSAEAIGTAWKVVGEKAISPFLTEVDNIKVAKIKEASEKAVILAKPKSTKKVAEPPTQPAPKAVERPKAGSANPKPVRRPVNKTATFVKKSNSASALNKPVKSSKPPPERELTEEDVMEKAVEFFSEAIIAGLSDGNWKTRLSAMEQFNEIAANFHGSDISSQLLIKLLAKKPGFKDNNFQVLKLRLECLLTVSENLEITTTGATVCLTDMVTLLGDAKNNTVATKVLLKFAERLGLDFVSTEVLEYAFSQQKNPKVQQEALLWVSNAILEFGFNIEPKSVMENVKKGVAASNPNVRSAAITLLGTMYLYVGSKLRLFFENEKPALLQQIDAEFDKHKGEKPPSPRRGKQKDSVNGNDNDNSDNENDRMVNIQDMVPRVDISSKISTSLVEELTHRDWKVRTEAINKLQEIISEARFITSNLGEVVPAISERLTDSNGRLAAASVALCESIAVAMGPACKIYVREFLPGLLQGLGDNKNYLRSAAIKCMNTWGDTAGYREFFEGEMFATALKSGSPTLRAELWTWLAEKLPEVKNVPKDELLACLPHLYNNLEDRNSDVRKNANEAVFGFMMHLSYKTMFNASEKVKPASVSTIKTVLDKTRGSHVELHSETRPTKPSSAPSGGSSNSSQSTVARSKSSIAVKPKSTVAPSKKKKDEDIDSTPLLKVNGLKMQRNIDENKLKVLKWNFTAPREEFVEQLRDQMNTAGVNRTLITNMFHPDFKFHLKALDLLLEDVAGNTPALISNLDLVLKWLTIRFFDTNPSVILRGLEYLNIVFRTLAEEGYNMLEVEAASFLPYLVLKTGDPKDTVRNLVKDIFDVVGSVYPISKLFTYVMDGVKSKNARQRTGCLEQLSRLIENYGLSVCQPSPAAALKEIAKQISDRDNSVRNAALNCVIAAYFITGDKVRQMIGRISDKDMSLLDERIKRASKARANIPVATVKPTQYTAPKRYSQGEPTSPPTNNNNTYVCESEDEMPLDDEEYPEEEEEAEPVPPTIVTPPKHETSERMKRFKLDVNVIDAIEATAIVHPKPNLIEYDEKYFQEPVLPVTYTRQVTSPTCAYSTHTIVKSRSSPARANNLETWINAIGTSNNMADILRAVEQIEHCIGDDEKRKELDGLETTLITQIISRLTYLGHTEDPESVKYYKVLFALLTKLFSNQQFARNVSENNLQQLLTQLIGLLVEKRLERLQQAENWNLFQKYVNNLVLKILERSEHTAVICALFRILHESVASANADQHYQELIMKCIWKTIKYIPEWDPDLDYTRILTEIHKFLTDFPSAWWKKQPSDTPLRTYKTMVHAVVAARESEILTVVNYIPGFNQQTELYHYINKLLRHMNLEEKTDDMPDKAKYHMPRAFHEELSQILKKIGDKSETQQGLRMLYDFKNEHPEININQFLSKTSKFFQQYISRGLEEVQAEKDGRILRDVDKYIENVKNSDTRENIAGMENGSGDNFETDAQHFKQKLEMLQMRAGWNQYKKIGSTPSVHAEQPSNLIPTLRITSPPQQFLRDADEDSTSIEQLRRKLTQLKSGNV